MQADPSEVEPTDYVRLIKDKEKQAESALSAWKKESKRNYDMVAGDGNQWLPEDRAKLEEQNRVAVEFNRTGSIVDAVCGSEINNRQEVTFIPRVLGEVNTTGLANVRTAAARWARDNCDAEDEESDAFGDVLICGVGVTHTRMDYEEEEEGKIVIERIDPLEMRWDPAATKRNLSDARWVSRTRKYSREEIEAKWPDKADEIAFASPEKDLDDSEEKVVDPKNSYKGMNGEGTSKDDMIDVTHWQGYELACMYKVLDPTTRQIVTMDEERFAVAQQMDPALKYAKQPKRVYKEAFVCGNIELECGDAPCQKGFTYQFITGKRDRNHKCFYGLVRPMRDPQMWANKFFSQILHILNTNAKGGVLVEKGATDNIKKLEESWAKSDSVTTLNPGGLAKVQQKPTVQIPAALWQLAEFAVNSIRDCPGVSLELLGMADRQQAGVLEDQRTRSSLTILAPFFGALRMYRKRQGRLLSYFIQEYISDGRLIRVVDAEGERFIQLMREADDVDYETIVDDTPASRDTKEKTWVVLREILPMMLSQGITPPMEMLDYAPIPASLAAAIKKAIQQKQAQGQANPMMQAELANKAADTELKEAGAAEKYVKAGTAGIQALMALMGPQQPGPGGMPQQPQQPPQTIQ